MIINTQIKGSGSTPAGKYQLLQRITDDSNNEIGTVCGFIKDSNNTEYAVVCLDAQYRTGTSDYATWGYGSVTGHPDSSAWDNTETATENCAHITGTPVSNCKANSFVIGGQTYTGLLPVVKELAFIAMHRTAINTLDPTATTYSDRIIGAVYSWASTAYNNNAAWYWSATYGDMLSKSTSNTSGSIPILELPNE